MKRKFLVAVLVLLCVAIAIIPLMMIKDSEFAGADGEAEETISRINPDYEPWFGSLIEPPGSETESLMFAVQASVGAGIMGFGFGYFAARTKYSHEMSDKKLGGVKDSL